MIDLLFWVDAIRYRWRVVAAAVGVTVVLALLYFLVAPQVYTATTTLVFNSNAPTPLSEESETIVDDGLETEIDIVSSGAVAEIVVEELGLTDDAEMKEDWQALGGGEPFDEWLVGRTQENIQISKSSGSRVISVAATSSDPEYAMQLANAYGKASRDKLLSLSPAAASGYLGQLEEEVAQAKEAVGEAEGRLSAFVSRTGITNNGDLGAEAIRNASIAIETASANAQAAGALSRGGVSEYAVEAAEKSAAVQSLRSQLATKRSELSELSATKGPNHPHIISAKAEVAMLEEDLRKEREATIAVFAAGRTAEINSERAATGATAGTLSAAAARQNERLNAMSQNIGRMTTLQSELAATQAHYADLSARLERMKLESRLPIAMVSSLDMAATPTSPSSPRYGLLLFCAIMLGLIAGSIAAIILESLNPYVRNALSVQRALGMPVLGRITLPKRTIFQLTDARSEA